MFLSESYDLEMLFNINLFLLHSLCGGKCACAVLMLSAGEWGEMGREDKKGGDHQEQIPVFFSTYVVDTVSHTSFTRDECPLIMNKWFLSKNMNVLI